MDTLSPNEQHARSRHLGRIPFPSLTPYAVTRSTDIAPELSAPLPLVIATPVWSRNCPDAFPRLSGNDPKMSDITDYCCLKLLALRLSANLFFLDITSRTLTAADGAVSNDCYAWCLLTMSAAFSGAAIGSSPLAADTSELRSRLAGSSAQKPASPLLWPSRTPLRLAEPQSTSSSLASLPKPSSTIQGALIGPTLQSSLHRHFSEALTKSAYMIVSRFTPSVMVHSHSQHIHMPGVDSSAITPRLHSNS